MRSYIRPELNACLLYEHRNGRQIAPLHLERLALTHRQLCLESLQVPADVLEVPRLRCRLVAFIEYALLPRVHATWRLVSMVLS